MNLPLGYQYSSVYARIRKTEKDDLGLIFSEFPANTAGVFTQNLVAAAPVKQARSHLKATKGLAKAVLVNAGNANCATRTGASVVRNCCKALAQQLRINSEQILPASTGVIGVELDEDLILRVIPDLIAGLSPDRFEDVAKAILTTDLVMKVESRKLELQDGTVHVCGMTKGSGMIQPRMATTLGFILTDAALSTRRAKDILNVAVNRSYNRLSVDGDTSTNDTLILMANGASGFEPKSGEYAAIEGVICEVAESLARQIAKDGEGARKLITIDVSGAEDTDAAEQIARSIANSPLVKTAVAGSDPNWGRILSAAGNAGVAFNPRKVNIDLQGTRVCAEGVAAEMDEAGLKHMLDAPECVIRFQIEGKGKGAARFWTCDLTEKYIEINGSYRT